MLAALLLAGLATAALVPLVFDMLGDDDDDVIDMAGPGASKVEVLSAIAEAPVEGDSFDIAAQSSQTTLPGFDPASDTCTLHADSWDTEFVVEDLADGGQSLSYAVGDGPVRVCFPDAAELPVEAIAVVIQGPQDDSPVTLSLAEIFAATGAEDGPEDGAPTSPVDPDTPDQPGPGTGDDAALPPVDPDQPGAPDGLPVTEEVLQPVTDDDPVSPAQATSDVAWLIPGKAGAAAVPPVIHDFSAADHMLAVTLTKQFANGPLEVTVTPSVDGADGIVSVDGTPVAILKGAPDADPSNIHVEVQARVTL